MSTLADISIIILIKTLWSSPHHPPVIDLNGMYARRGEVQAAKAAIGRMLQIVC
jgi:hypothetical protein